MDCPVTVLVYLRLMKSLNDPGNSCEDQIFRFFTKDTLRSLVLAGSIQVAAVYASSIPPPPHPLPPAQLAMLIRFPPGSAPGHGGQDLNLNLHFYVDRFHT